MTEARSTSEAPRSWSGRYATSSAGTLHRVIERPYPARDWQQHAGDTVCGLIVSNGVGWSWDIVGVPDTRWTRRRCFFCFSGTQVDSVLEEVGLE